MNNDEDQLKLLTIFHYVVAGLAAISLAYLWAGAHYLLAARHVGPDLAAVRKSGI